MTDTPTDKAARLARQRHQPAPTRLPSKAPQNPLTALVTVPVEFARSLNPHRQQSTLAAVAFYGTVGALVALEVLDPILGAVVVVGHALASSSGPTAIVGRAVEEAAGP